MNKPRTIGFPIDKILIQIAKFFEKCDKTGRDRE